MGIIDLFEAPIRVGVEWVFSLFSWWKKSAWWKSSYRGSSGVSWTSINKKRKSWYGKNFPNYMSRKKTDFSSFSGLKTQRKKQKDIFKIR